MLLDSASTSSSCRRAGNVPRIRTWSSLIRSESEWSGWPGWLDSFSAVRAEYPEPWPFDYLAVDCLNELDVLALLGHFLSPSSSPQWLQGWLRSGRNSLQVGHLCSSAYALSENCQQDSCGLRFIVVDGSAHVSARHRCSSSSVCIHSPGSISWMSSPQCWQTPVFNSAILSPL